jgi:hypothetical protein
MKPNTSSFALSAALVAMLGAPALSGAQERIVPSSEEESPQITRRSSTSASEGAEFLLLPVGARAVGMGGAVTGMRGAGDLVLWNPSGVASLDNVQLLFNHSETAFDTRSEVLSLLWPVESFATLGVTYYLVDYGDLPSTGVDGSVRGSINFRNQEFLFTMAGRVVGGLEFGVNYKLIQLVFRCDGQCVDSESFTRSTHAVDLGLIYDRLAGVPLSVGASVRHLGFALKGASEHDPLPTRVRVGMAYQVLSAFTQDEALKLALALDVEDQMRGMGDPDVMVGSEFGVAEVFYLRAGYAFLDSGLGGPSLGLGVTYDWFYLDLSRGFDEVATATGDEAVQVTFGVLF